MPGSTTLFGPTADEDETDKNSEPKLMSAKQPPPVAPRTTSVSIQSWQSANSGGDNYGDNRHARSASMDSLESSESSSSGGGSSIANQQNTASEYIPTRNVGKIMKLPPHNPLQFVKVQSPLYKKAEQQIKLTKEVKITREALKEGEEEWQSNLDNWKSRRRKVSEKVIQRAEEWRQIEAEEQLRQDQCLQQQRKIKKFSEIVEKRSSSRSYSLDLYIGQGDDSGLGGTPEPDDIIDSHCSVLRSDTSEGVTSEAESIDSDIHKSDKIHEKEPPKVPQKPQKQFKSNKVADMSDNSINSTNHFTHHHSGRDFEFSSAEPSDVDGHTGDSEVVSSEEDISYVADNRKSEVSIKSLNDQSKDNCNLIINGSAKAYTDSVIKQDIPESRNGSKEKNNTEPADRHTLSFSVSIKPGDSRGFGFTLKGGKDQGCPAYIDSVIKYSPADVAGLKKDDKIISMNGELAADYSHASLIFYIKQAVYVGILDIVVARSETNVVEVKKKRKSSFAEKIALFSSGLKSTATNLEDNKTSSKADESKSESLVLRRRSAFENGNRENNITHRRSSCLIQGASGINIETADKRLSIDLSQYQSPENGIVKKGPPPPVPVKPKLKPNACHDLQKSDSVKTTDIERFNSNECTNTYESITNISNCENFFDNCCNKVDSEELKYEENYKESIDNSLNSEINHGTECNSYSKLGIFSSSFSNNCAVRTYTSTDSENEEKNVLKLIPKEFRDPTLNENFIPASFNSFLHSNSDSEELQHETEGKIKTEMFTFAQNMAESESYASVTLTSLESLHQDNLSMHGCIINNSDEKLTQSFSDSNEIGNCSLEKNSYLDNNSSDKLISHTLEGVSDENVATYNLSINMRDMNLTDNENAKNYFEIEENISTTDKTLPNAGNLEEENVSNIQINPSPLCLPLEKIDEDDVISASTTTSSETPDTETVIETLPSNVSPLPNDESNGEESSKPLNCQEKESEYFTEPSETSYDTSKPNYLDNPEYLTFENVPIREEFSSTITENCEDIYDYPDDQDSEYCRELDESIDQITSLDVIDEIEQQLMHQLEQQGEAFEDMDEGLSGELVQDISNQWLYFTEETELLDDLTPSNLEPPREPPPPPPPPELDDISDEKILPMTRTNSTKRIKKELWRRRSDFLGLKFSESIDVDNILPPPPGLEEILKKEREQTQWLEKRLSLAETDISAPLYMNVSGGMQSGDCIQSDYNSEFFLEEPETLSEVPVNVACEEQWKENLIEKNVLESSELQCGLSSDLTIAVSEETYKINESQHKAKQNLHNLGAAPKAKIMESDKWITEKVTPVSKKSVELMFPQSTYNQNYWLSQDDERKRNTPITENLTDRRYSMPVFQSSYPDVTVRTWGDREYEFQKQRPKSAAWNSSKVDYNIYNSFSHKQDVLLTQSFDSYCEVSSESDVLESAVHKCSCCGKGLCEGSAMGIEALRLYFHIECFRCCICHMQLGNGSCGTDVQVKNNQLYCSSCFTID